VAGRLLVWLGAIALVSRDLLIRYSIEIGLMTPAARMTGRPYSALPCSPQPSSPAAFRDDERIAQALAGAGSQPSMPCLWKLCALSSDRSGTVGAMIAVTVAAHPSCATARRRR